MTARCSISDVIDLMDTVGMKQFLSYQVGKETCYLLVNPQTLFSLHCWEKCGTVLGSFSRETQETLQQCAFKKYLRSNELTMRQAQQKARDLFNEFIGGTDG